MKISELKEYYPEIVSRIDQLKRNDTNSLGQSFFWDEAEEGKEFWQQIDNGDIYIFYQRYPKVFKEGDGSHPDMSIEETQEIVSVILGTQPKERLYQGISYATSERFDSFVYDRFGKFIVVNRAESRLIKNPIPYKEWLNYLGVEPNEYDGDICVQPTKNEIKIQAKITSISKAPFTASSVVGKTFDLSDEIVKHQDKQLRHMLGIPEATVTNSQVFTIDELETMKEAIIIVSEQFEAFKSDEEEEIADKIKISSSKSIFS